jgi:hypothetical protein
MMDDMAQLYTFIQNQEPGEGEVLGCSKTFHVFPLGHKLENFKECYSSHYNLRLIQIHIKHNLLINIILQAILWHQRGIG